MGLALGVIRLSYDDFCRLTPDEFSDIVEAWQEHQETKDRGAWERTRILGAIVIQPHLKKSVTPKKLLPLPWDRVVELKKEKTLSREESRRRFESLMERRSRSQA